MKFELKFKDSRARKRLIFAGSGPHRPKLTKESDLSWESLVRTVKKESMEKEGEREVLFPTMARSVMWLLEQTMEREEEGGREQKLVQFDHPCST